MKDLTNEQLQENWDKLISLIENTFAIATQLLVSLSPKGST